MAFSPRNLLGNGGGIKESALEAALNPRDDSLYGTQILGYLANGNCIGMEALEIIKNLGDRFVLTPVTTTGTAVNEIRAATASLPPFLRLTTGLTTNDNLQLQYAAPITAGSGSYTAWAPFTCKAGYDISMFARFQLTTTVDNAAMGIGLATVDSTIRSAGAWDVNDYVGFYKNDGASATMVGQLIDDTTAQTGIALTVGGTSGWTPTINTWYNIGMRIQGRTSITFYVNGEKTGTTTLTRIPDDVAVLCPSIFIEAGTGAAATLEVQAFSVFQEAR